MEGFMLKQYILKQFDNYEAFVYHLFTFVYYVFHLYFLANSSLLGILTIVRVQKYNQPLY